MYIYYENNKEMQFLTSFICFSGASRTLASIRVCCVVGGSGEEEGEGWEIPGYTDLITKHG